MNLTIIISITAICAILVIFFLGRWLYIRSVKMRNEANMAMIFTNITHELLTPLTIISASVERLRLKTPENTSEYDMMDLNIQRVVRLLQQILETSKSQAGELKLLVSNGDVMGYIRETARCIEPLMVKNGLKYTVTCQPQSMMGWIDTDKLDKIIFNLLSNAAKYTHGDEGHVELDVKTNKTYDHIIIRVRDNGCGIPKKNMKHLFERFYDGEYRRFRASGTGIGLALTRDLVYLHGGDISCDSIEGKGTTFTVTLPISKDSFSPAQIDEKNKVRIDIPQSTILDFKDFSTKDTTEAESESEEIDDDAYKILVVEDNAELLMLMKQLLSIEYHVYTACNGKDALEKLKHCDVDLIISDVMMPEMNGNELTEQIKLNPDLSHLPIILLTAKTQEDDKKQSLMIGADEYIHKPFKMGDLQLRINNLIQNRMRIQRDFQKQTLEETKQKTANDYSPDSIFLKKAIDCVKEHISDSDYNRDTFAYDMGTSPSTLYNKLRSITGLSVSSFIRDIRIKTACRLAQERPDIRVSDLAYSVGFKDPKYFATIFKKELGMQPKEYIEQFNPKQNEN